MRLLYDTSRNWANGRRNESNENSWTVYKSVCQRGNWSLSYTTICSINHISWSFPINVCISYASKPARRIPIRVSPWLGVICPLEIACIILSQFSPYPAHRGFAADRRRVKSRRNTTSTWTPFCTVHLRFIHQANEEKRVDYYSIEYCAKSGWRIPGCWNHWLAQEFHILTPAPPHKGDIRYRD